MDHSLLDLLAKELPSFSYAFADERGLHDAIAAVLSLLDISFTREHIAGADRFDFLCPGGLVIEAKIRGSWSAALRQIDRYCLREDVSAVLVVTTRAWGRVAVPAGGIVLRKKPVKMAHLGGQSF